MFFILLRVVVADKKAIAFPKGSRSASTIAYGMRLHQEFATGEMGFNDKFALQKILNCSSLITRSGVFCRRLLQRADMPRPRLV
jgi:hypothetical protein